MNKLQTLYNLLQINHKIENHFIRFMYLHDIWGMEQQLIADCEGCSQSYVSREIIAARKLFTHQDLIKESHRKFTGEEIQYLQQLPREVISDMECLAFITEILQLHPYHPFFQFYDTSVSTKIAALVSLGVQNKRLVKLYGKSQPSISMIGKRYVKRAQTMERPNRYDKVEDYRFQQADLPFTFKLAGGQNND